MKTILLPDGTAVPAHVRDNLVAADMVLDASDLERLDQAFPRPGRRIPLETR